MSKKDIKICRYCDCQYPNKEIDLEKNEYVDKNKAYYHKKCYELKVDSENKINNQKCDIQLIKNMWIENISRTVVYKQLYNMLNNLLARGIESDYLVFVMQYCVEHKLNLNHPNGFPYFVDNPEIKEAYRKKQIPKVKVDFSSFSVAEKENNSPKFSVNKKSKGFQSILDNKK